MSAMQREDIHEANQLDEIIDVDSLSSKQVMSLIIGFCDECLLSEKITKKMNINLDFLHTCKYIVSQAKEFSEGKISVSELNNHGIYTWKLYYNAEAGSLEKSLARVIVACLCDDEDKKLNEYGVELAIEAFYSLLLDIGIGYCKLFTNYVKERVINGRL